MCREQCLRHNANMTAAVWVALVTGVLGFAIGVLNFFVSRARLKKEHVHFETQLKDQREQFEAGLKQQQQQFKAQLELSREQMLLEHPDLGRLHNPNLGAIQTIRGLLQDENYPARTFATIRHHLPGRADEEIRALLRSMGAIKLNGDPERWRLPSTRSEVGG
jgi:hypothetical protein